MNILVVGRGLAQTGISPVGIGIGLVTQQLVKLKPVGLELAVRLELELELAWLHSSWSNWNQSGWN